MVGIEIKHNQMHKMEASIRQARIPSTSLKGSVEADIGTSWQPQQQPYWAQPSYPLNQ